MRARRRSSDFVAERRAVARVSLRFDWELRLDVEARLVPWPYVAAQYWPRGFGVPRFAWRYVGLRETSTVLSRRRPVGCSAARAGSGLILDAPARAHAMLPRASFCRLRPRALARHLRDAHANAPTQFAPSGGDAVPTMLIGAGHAGRLIVQEIASHPSIGIRPVGFLDDDPVKVGTVLQGLPVIGTTAELAASCRKHGAAQVLIAIASARGKDIRRIKNLCDEAEIPAKIIPGIHEIVGGQVNLSRIREVTIEDLLGREPIALESDDVAGEIRDRVVLVSGAGGSIGSELAALRISRGSSPPRAGRKQPLRDPS